VDVVVIVIGIVLVVVVVGWFVASRRNPEDAADHRSTPARTGSAEFFGDVNDRPGSPGAEAMDVPERGSPAPGPGADTGG